MCVFIPKYHRLPLCVCGISGFLPSHFPHQHLRGRFLRGFLESDIRVALRTRNGFTWLTQHGQTSRIRAAFSDGGVLGRQNMSDRRDNHSRDYRCDLWEASRDVIAQLQSTN